MFNLRNYLSQLLLRYWRWELGNREGTARIAKKDAKALREKVKKYEKLAENCGYVHGIEDKR